MQTGIIFDIKRYAIHDGPGIRPTVFFKGCPLTCPWCHNPEGIDRSQRVVYRKSVCIGCLECLEACPEQALSATPDGIHTDEQCCQHCGTCVDACPSGAREQVGKNETVSSLMHLIKKDVPFFDTSGGGVTFSGGEPLMQPEFLFECLRLCGRAGIHRAVDTSGYAELEIIKQIAMETDLFLYDLKFMDSEKHRHFTGVSNPLILTNLKYLARSGARVTIRFPLIPGINDNDENIDLVGMFLRILPEIETVHILPYHGYQENKYIHLDTIYMAKNIPTPTPDDLSRAKKRFEGFGLKVDIGG
ncbi:MAG: glycyl-radical enzyme activating protein [Deltaproteobacteria bacterium]